MSKDKNIGALLGLAVESHRRGGDSSLSLQHVVAHLADTALTAEEIAEAFVEMVNKTPMPAELEK